MKLTDLDRQLMGEAYNSSCACNINAVANSLARVIRDIKEGHSSYAASCHPAVIVWIDIARNITGHEGADGGLIADAYSSCHEAAAGAVKECAK